MMLRVTLALALGQAVTASYSHFLSIGDWGDYEAERIVEQFSSFTPEFILALGDNFYPSGVTSINDLQFKTKFEKMFGADSLQIPWFVVPGNHDYYGGLQSVNSEIAYTEHQSRWYMPSTYYTKFIRTRDFNYYTIIALDTWRIDGGDPYVKYDIKSGRGALRSLKKVEEDFASGVLPKEHYEALLNHFEEEDPSDPIVVSGDDEQVEWFNRTLCGSEPDSWKIVLGHYPILSATVNEHGETPSMIESILPILEGCNDGRVMYFSGHDHVLQHNQKNDVDYFGSGAGARVHLGMNTSYPYLKGYHSGAYGFMHHHTGANTTMVTDFILHDGSIPYSYSSTVESGE